jgi:hypothetical protein
MSTFFNDLLNYLIYFNFFFFSSKLGIKTALLYFYYKIWCKWFFFFNCNSSRFDLNSYAFCNSFICCLKESLYSLRLLLNYFYEFNFYYYNFFIFSYCSKNYLCNRYNLSSFLWSCIYWAYFILNTNASCYYLDNTLFGL